MKNAIKMSESKKLPITTKKIIIRPVTKVTNPILIKKTSLQNIDVNKDLLKRLTLDPSSRSLFREDVIFTSKAGDSGNPHSITIVNRVNLFTNSNRTVAKYSTPDDLFFEKTSDSVTRLIGQKSYDTLFSALTSVSDEELKVNGLLSLLTLPKKSWDTASQTEELKFNNEKDLLTVEDKNVQTDQTCIIDNMFKAKHLKKVNKRKHITPYVVQDKVKETQANTKKGNETDLKEETGNATKDPLNVKTERETNQLLDLKHDVDFLCNDKSNDSTTSFRSVGSLGRRVSTSSEVTQLLNILTHHTDQQQEESILPDSTETNLNTIENIPLDSNLKTLVKVATERLENTTNSSSIDTSRTNNLQEMIFNNATVNSTLIRMLDGTDIYVPVKPEDHFHIATPAILSNVTKEERAKLLWFQAYIDWKFCDVRDEDGFLPIHNAVRNNDVSLLKRQCFMLTKKGMSIDEPACNMTALQMSLFNESSSCLSILLRHGGDPFGGDEEERGLAHLAADNPASHLHVILTHCRQRARQLLEEHEDLWNPSLKNKSDAELAQFLLDHICNSMDGQGYTPLMLASKAGLPDNVKLLVEASPSCVSKTMASSGNTALFLAVGEACMDADRRGNRLNLSENFRRTIEILLDHGADPTTENYSGSTVSDLLQEICVPDILKLISDHVKTKFGHDSKDLLNPLMIVKKENEDTDIDEMREPKKAKRKVKKHIIVEDIPIKFARLDIPPNKGKTLKAVGLKDKIEKVATPKRGNKSKLKMDKTDSKATNIKTEVTVKQEVDKKAEVNEIVINRSSVGNMVVQNNYYVNDTGYIANTNINDDRKGQIACVSAPIAPQNSVNNVPITGSRIIILNPTNTAITTQANVLNLPYKSEQNVINEFLIPKKQNCKINSEILNVQSNLNNEVSKLAHNNEINNATVNLNAKNEFFNETSVDNTTNITNNVVIHTLPSDGKSKINVLRLKRKTKLIQSDVSAKTTKKIDNT